jgi:predicted pyridoxine 5'-phosphate oxidase superfamily flavin-nucleotide-binding protein
MECEEPVARRRAGLDTQSVQVRLDPVHATHLATWGRFVGSRPLVRESRLVKLTTDMQRVVREQSLGFVATVTPDGRPNLSPKGTTTVFDDEHLMFADVASPATVRNLATNPNVEVNVVDPIVRKGYRFKGTAVAYTNGPTYEQGLTVLRERGSTTPRERIRSIVVIEVTDAAPIFSPAYDTGATEASLAERWLRHHSELHPPHPPSA